MEINILMTLQSIKMKQTSNILIEQLQVSPKWNEFKAWYVKQQIQQQGGTIWWNINLQEPKYEEDIVFNDLPFEFQKGVFEKFLQDSEIKLHQYNTGWCQITRFYPPFAKTTDTFEEILLWYFDLNEL